MNTKYTFLDLAEEILSESNMPLTVQEIWDEAIRKKIDKKVSSKGKTPDRTLSAVLYDEAKKEKKSRFNIVSRRPTLFWLSNRPVPSKDHINEKLEDVYAKDEKDNSVHEREYHQVLTNFVNSCSLGNINTKTIFHEISKKGKKGENKWDYPDMVGVSFVFSENTCKYEPSSLELMKIMQYPMCKLYSFELKKSLNYGNFKEAFFQAVSNSSWANEGYLVSVEIEEDELLNTDLKRLCYSFGIGLIQLNIENIEDSRIVYPAISRDTLDMTTINLLVSKNNDFSDFIINVNNSMKLNRIVDKEKYDKVLSDDEIQKYLLKLQKMNNKRS